ncbi:hypothetical protein K8Z61_05845 [Nocardioides sp. TRM66260-LWL]|uniref:hypothetical protein n=1 Tax=Nocardioides sp. TRM66260-LWL TaxID=2874478 RepID=UPI001CC81A94|nr:hypothetical protein [Nocardioides sp. TRM66260-LWL]MBZ5734013.1 hypothetical protein [Nocardioides sp. TRM66260-LWL]
MLLVAVVVGAVLRLVIDRAGSPSAADTASEACPSASSIPTGDRVALAARSEGRTDVLCTYVSDGRAFWWTSGTPVTASEADWLQGQVSDMTRGPGAGLGPGLGTALGAASDFVGCSGDVLAQPQRPLRRSLLFIDDATPVLVLEDGGRCGFLSAAIAQKGRTARLVPTTTSSIDDLTRGLHNLT